MTIYAAKELEFPLVCVADLGRPPARDSGSGLEISEDGRLGLRLASLSGDTRDSLDMEELKREQRARADQEEKRIFHVAMTRARDHLILSGAVDAEKWPEPKPLCAPADWLWRGLAPGAKELLGGTSTGVESHEVGGEQVQVRCVLCTPATVDDVLPPDARAPGGAAYSRELVLPEQAPRRFDRVPAPRSLPVARLSYSALESYNRCGYRFYLERVAGLRGPEPAAAVRLAPPARNGQLVLRLEEPPPAEPVPGVTPLLRGTIVHQLLERFAFEGAEPPPPGD